MTLPFVRTDSVCPVEKQKHHSNTFLISNMAESLHVEIVDYHSENLVIVSDVVKQQS